MKILVIGMGPGVGLATARRFGREGFEVVMVARKAQKLQEFQDQLTAENIRSSVYPADIADAAAFRQVLEQIARDHDDIEVLHYNPSAYNPAMPSEISLPVFLSDFNINVVGGLLAYQAVFPQMKTRQRGAIFLTGGGTALQAPPILASLGVGKAGLRNLAFSLAQEGSPLNIHVATITICGMIQPGTQFDPDLIAAEFWRLYCQPQEAWQTEIVMQ